jgi:hypothetical protein
MGFQLRRHQFVSNVGRAAVQAALYSSPSSQSKSEPMHGTPLLCYEPLRISRALSKRQPAIRSTRVGARVAPASETRHFPGIPTKQKRFFNSTVSQNFPRTRAVRTSAKFVFPKCVSSETLNESSQRLHVCGLLKLNHRNLECQLIIF